MNIDAQASAGHIIRVLHLSVAFFPPIACVSNYQSESDLFWHGWERGTVTTEELFFSSPEG